MIRDLVRRKEVHFDRVVGCRLHVFVEKRVCFVLFDKMGRHVLDVGLSVALCGP